MFSKSRLDVTFSRMFATLFRVAYTTSFLALMIGFASWTESATAAGKSPFAHGSIQRPSIHGQSLVGNLEGDSANRHISVYLPPSYKNNSNRKYPVLYLLHGFTQTDLSWFGEPGGKQQVPDMLDRAIAAGATEMIVVTPNAMTVYGGSNYSSGQTTGDWEAFIADELVAWVDSNYRTRPERGQRAIAGHSMGGMGAMRIGMRHANTFGTMYLLSPCCLGSENNLPKTAEDIAAMEVFRTRPANFEVIPVAIRTAVAAAAAWAPNPQNPPTFFDSPFAQGKRQEAVIARMTANRPLVMVDQYIRSLKTQTIAFDVGDQDLSIAVNLKELDRILTAYGVGHRYEVYEGNHTNRVPERLELQMIPFVSRNFR